MLEFSEEKIRYLEMIQGAVTRMESNSFFLKGGTVTLAAGVLALSSAGVHKKYVLIAFMAIVVLWILDSYYLSLQRKYRRLFNYIRVEESMIDFDMNYHKADGWTVGDRRTSFLSCLFSRTEWPFYAVISAIVSILLSLVSAK
ncbi:hypothetical protein JZ785_18285 [Alicyclobacillus curvatus]|nr:hypothetical protein JZ785_18285 [Alicyclobacillus curvatus]